MNYTIYDPATGQIQHLISASNQDNANLMLEGQTYVTGHYDPNMFYIDQGKPCARPPKPMHENLEHVFDWTTKTWQVDLELSGQKIKNCRQWLLQDVDRVNPIWYASLTVEQQQQLQAYRLALLAVPQQAGFPSQVEWPSKPTWL